ncbi:3-oxoacid CoA-transferase subunit B [Paracandidimonas soli]|uniref:3-oxoadipate CoA-transferase beta subunit n=1 Tax=Paracandidimonas soli TaxID=1917182 RepID=A0A4R3VGP0_9BURK|nr:3-oxoacid CoA-transferase subunit B [Paracandidimonas soli]TCV02879.1 3-oxoadipate CoA-transferase beta subunit [Paracandidimonas soli]
MYKKLSRQEIARKVASNIPEGYYVNLGIGIPTLAARYLPEDREVILHTENGIVGMGPGDPDQPLDLDLINASKEPVTLIPGSALTDHVVSFAMMRGGHIDLTILGAFQVSEQGDLANWDNGRPDDIPAVGGAMDLAVGARQVYVTMEHVTRDGQPKIVERCTYPLTGEGVVDRIYTDLAVIDVTGKGLVVTSMVEGLTFDELQSMTGAPLALAETVTVLS